MPVLDSLRQQPASAVAAYGFVVRGEMLHDLTGGACSLECEKIQNTGVYKLTVNAGQRDWYIPFGQGQARYCDVPKNQPDGTLVVTFPMNGCALEVREMANANRFFHDSDGKSMPGGDADAKCRIEYQAMAGSGESVARAFEKYVTSKMLPGNFEHTLIAVKAGELWHVYQTGVVTANEDYFQIKDSVPQVLDAFRD